MSRNIKPYPITAPRDGKERFALVKRTAAQLGEHFDSVVIICTKVDAGGTQRFDWGAGNAYAIIESMREVLDARSSGAPTINDLPSEDEDD